MLKKRRQKLWMIAAILLGVSVSVSFALVALKKNINLYFTPDQLLANHSITPDQTIRLGGMVETGSVHHAKNSLKVSFELRGIKPGDIQVVYDGILPSLFRQGQGIVTEGHMNAKGVFMASQVLAKHDANYHPPLLENAKNA